MKIQDIVGRPIKISKGTITVLNESGKPAGMITRITTFYNANGGDQFSFFDKMCKSGADRDKIDWTRMFLVGGEWYYLLDDRRLAKAYEYQEFDGVKPIAKIEDGKLAARQFGATIIHVARIHDGRQL